MKGSHIFYIVVCHYEPNQLASNNRDLLKPFYKVDNPPSGYFLIRKPSIFSFKKTWRRNM